MPGTNQLGVLDEARPAVACECRNVGVELPSSEGTRRILDGIDLEVPGGQILSIMGRSGTGKTTLLRVLGGLLQATRDSVVNVNGHPVSGPPEGVVMVFQNYAASLLPWRTIERNVALGLEGHVSRTEIKRCSCEALEMVGLADRAQDYPGQMSGGMQQRVQLARALAMRPSGLLMDEPFGALDAMTKASLQDELLHVQERTGATVLFVTHDVDEAVYLSDRVVILEGSPAGIGRDITIDLPRPRHQLATKELPEYLRLRRMVYDEVVGHHA